MCSDVPQGREERFKRGQMDKDGKKSLGEQAKPAESLQFHLMQLVRKRSHIAWLFTGEREGRGQGSRIVVYGEYERTMAPAKA